MEKRMTRDLSKQGREKHSTQVKDDIKEPLASKLNLTCSIYLIKMEKRMKRDNYN